MNCAVQVKRAETKIVKEGNMKTVQDEEAGGQLLTMSRAEIKELVQREVMSSLLSHDWMNDEKMVSRLNKAKTSGLNKAKTPERNMNNDASNNNAFFDDDDLSLAPGDCENPNKNSNNMSNEEWFSGCNNAVKNPGCEDLVSKRILAIEEQVASGFNVVHGKIEGQRQEIIKEINGLLLVNSNGELQRSNVKSPVAQNRSLTEIFNRPYTNNIPHDTFSLMMISTLYKRSWWYGFAIFVFQMTLLILIVYNQLIQGAGSSKFNVPFHVHPEVRVAQFMSILFCVVIQSDVLVSVQNLTLLWKTTRWDKAILDRGDDTDPPSTRQWLLHILLPNLMRLVEGILGLFVSFVVIVQSDYIIDLLRDFTALMIVSELDNMGFRLAAHGYIGKEMYLEALKVKDKSVSPLSLATSLDEDKICNGFVIRPLILTTILSCMIGGWLQIVVQQVRGEIFYQRYPDCMGVTPEFAKEHFGNGKCYGGNMNTLGCDFEGGDCMNFNLEYPLCRGDDLLDVEEELANDTCNMIFAIDACGFDNNACCSLEYTSSDTFGDGVCNFDKDSGPNTEICQYENGDCLELNDMYCSGMDKKDCCPISIVNGALFKNSICNGGISATPKCRFDGTDCNNFRNEYPSCPFDRLAVIDGSDNVTLGDGFCDSGVYSIEDCGWEFGDCAVGQIGQDLLEFAGITTVHLEDIPLAMNTKMSADGSTLAVGTPITDEKGRSRFAIPGRVQLFHYHSTKQLWISLGTDLVGDSITDTFGDIFGATIAFSKNGTRLAVGASLDRSHGEASGQVRVFGINFSTRQSPFTQVGQSIYGESPDDEVGSAIDIIADGSMLAIAAPGNDKGGSNAGQIRIFRLQDKSTPFNLVTMEWIQVAEILGQNDGEYIGNYSLNLSPSDGSVVMFSASFSKKRIYALDIPGTDSIIEPTQIGADIPSSHNPNTIGSTTEAMSGDGSRIANINQVLDYNATSNTYSPIQGIVSSQEDFDTAKDLFGYGVALSIDGNILALSSIELGCDGMPTYCATGAIELFAYDPTSKIFRAAIPNPKYRRDNIIKEEKGTQRDSSVFGLQLSLAKNVDSDDASTTSTWLSVRSYNFETEKGYVKVYNLIEQFFLQCRAQDPSLIGNGVCNPLLNTEECGWDSEDCSLYNSFVGCAVPVPSLIGDGVCHNFLPYYTAECKWDGGDCSPP